MPRIPVEYLHTLTPAGIQHNLQLKKGTPVMFLRNLRPPLICNGTRGVVTRLTHLINEVSLIHSQEIVLVPKLPLLLEVENLKFKRVQFPLRPSFSMTINKSQGQTLLKCGINLSTEPFGHGQLYVALSRTGSAKNIYVYAPENKTMNVVLKISSQNNSSFFHIRTHIFFSAYSA